MARKKTSRKKTSRRTTTTASPPRRTYLRTAQPTKPPAQLEPVPRKYAGKKLAVVASGPSLTRADCARLRKHQIPTIAVNDGYRYCPFADIVYAADPLWWDHHIKAVRRICSGAELWTCQYYKGQQIGLQAATRHGLRVVRCIQRAGFSAKPDEIHHLGNSGSQAINFGLLTGPSVVYLLGFDMGRTGGKEHFFGDHPKALQGNEAGAQRPPSAFDVWRQRLAVASLGLSGQSVVNLTRETRLQAFPRADIEDVLP